MKKAPVSVRKIKGWRLCLLWPLAFLLKLWTRTLRFNIDAKDLLAVKTLEEPCLIVFWHNRLFVVAEAYRRFLKGKRPVAGLVSASKDGAWLADFFKLCGIYPIRGSSSARGGVALAALLDALKKGLSIAITPDGPRGPMYSVKPGTAWLAGHTGLPLLMLNITFCSAWRLKSWDGFYIPKPFSTVRVKGVLYPGMKFAHENQSLSDIKELIHSALGKDV